MITTARARALGAAGAAGRVGAAILAVALLVGCGVGAKDEQALRAPTTTAPTTTTSDPVIPGLDLGPTDGPDRADDPDRGGPTERDGDDASDDGDDSGIDPALEARIAEAVADFYEACEAGDDRACDLLFLTAYEDSEEEAFGADCGGRAPGTEDYCTPGLELDDDLLADPTDPVILALGDECRGDDAVACELIYQVLPYDEDLAQLGWTCNGRFPNGAMVSCPSGR